MKYSTLVRHLDVGNAHDVTDLVFSFKGLDKKSEGCKFEQQDTSNQSSHIVVKSKF
jgi:hypothetical protein